VRSLPRLAEALRRCKRLPEAERCAREVVQIHAAHPEWDDRDRRHAQWFLARTLDDAGRTSEAIESLGDFVAYGRSQPRAATKIASLEMLAWMLLKQGAANASDAELLMRECLALCEASRPDGEPRAWEADAALAATPPPGESHGGPCRADRNDDGLVNSQDFFDFVAAFFAGQVRADFNVDGALNSQDFFDFLAAFFAGCP
jgi:hypothetical protein